MNRFAGVSKGFALGATTNACTRGMWIWGKPIRLADDLHLLLLDTEGLGKMEWGEMGIYQKIT